MSGLVDIHCHGAAGAEFGTSEDATRRALAHHARAGVDTVVASLVSASARDLRERVTVLSRLVKRGVLAGIHLEGPFLSEARRGAHDPAHLRDPDTGLVELLVAIAAGAGAPTAIRQLTFAPERRGSDSLVRTLVAHGIRPAIGHTDADAARVERTIGMIAELQGSPALVTHLFNGMPPLHHRAGGPVAAALAAAARGEAVVEIIADGVHIAPEVVRMVFETVGPGSVALVSDAMAATGLGDGTYQLGEVEVEVSEGTARTTANGAIAGSTSTLADCVRWAVLEAGVDIVDAHRAATATPAAALGLEPSTAR
ncbi:MAG TPA: amidohydrolase family protein [Ornithinibacter sp.]|nr:amidohydrolase family protein [Ornithinibacter sp.]